MPIPTGAARANAVREYQKTHGVSREEAELLLSLAEPVAPVEATTEPQDVAPLPPPPENESEDALIARLAEEGRTAPRRPVQPLPASPQGQMAGGVSPAKEAPGPSGPLEVTFRSKYIENERAAGRADGAEARALRVTEAMKVSSPEATALLDADPTIKAWRRKAIDEGHIEEDSIPARLIGAVVKKEFGRDAYKPIADANPPKPKDLAPAAARSVAAARLMSTRGLVKEEAELLVGLMSDDEAVDAARAERGETATDQTAVKLGTETVDTVAQSAVDYARGASGLIGEGISLAKNLGVDPALYLGAKGADLYGLDTLAQKERELAEWEPVPEFWKAATETLLTSSSESVREVAKAMKSAEDRNAGLLTASVEAINSTPSWAPAGLAADYFLGREEGEPILDISGNATNLISRAATAALTDALPEEAPLIRTGAEIADDTPAALLSAAGQFGEAVLAAPGLGFDVVTGDTTWYEALAESAGAVGAAVQTGANPALESLTTYNYTTDSGGRRSETSVGRFTRVGGSLLGGVATTWYGRVADQIATEMYGAQSHRRRYAPGDVKQTWFNTLFPPLVTESGLHDYITTLERGDSLATEQMSLNDTIARGMSGLDAETRADWMQGGRMWNATVSAGMFGDLAFNLDAMPGWAAGKVATPSINFYEGMRAAQERGQSRASALLSGAAQAAPGLVDYSLTGDTDYRVGKTVASRGEPSPDIDAAAVAQALVYRDAMRRGRAGEVFADRASRDHFIAQQHAEYLSTLEVRQADVEDGVRGPADAERIVSSAVWPKTAEELRTLGWTDAEIGTLTEASAREAVAERRAPTTARGAPPAPEVFPGRPQVMDAAESRLVVEAEEQRAPLTTLPDDVLAIEDPHQRAGAAVVALAEHLGVEANSLAMTAALQTALSFVDPKSGRYYRAGTPVGVALDGLSANHITNAVRRLVNATPEQVWRNVMLFERGRPVYWADDVALEARADATSRRVPVRGNDQRVLAMARELFGDEPVLTFAGGYDGKGPLNAFQKGARGALTLLQGPARALSNTRARLRGRYAAAGAMLATLGEKYGPAGLDVNVPEGVDLVGVLEQKLREVAARPDADTKIIARGQAIVNRVRAARQRVRNAEVLFRAAVEYVRDESEARRPATRPATEKPLTARQRTRDTLVRLAEEEIVAYTPQQVDLYLSVMDRVAEGLVRTGVVKTPDEVFAKVVFREDAGTLTEGQSGLIDFTEFLRFGEAVVDLGTTADLSTLFHESGHLLRRLIKPEEMAELDAYVKTRPGFTRPDGSWDVPAEEWFAQQFEEFLREGRVKVKVKDGVVGAILARLNRIFRAVAEVLSTIYTDGQLEAVHPTTRALFEGWLAGKSKGAPPRALAAADMEPVRAPAPTPDAAPVPAGGLSPAQVGERVDVARTGRAEADAATVAAQAARRVLIERMMPGLANGIDAAFRGGTPTSAPRNRANPRAVVSEPPEAAPRPPVDLEHARLPERDQTTRWTPEILAWAEGEVARIEALPDVAEQKKALKAWLKTLFHDKLGMADDATKALRNKGYYTLAKEGVAYARRILDQNRQRLEVRPQEGSRLTAAEQAAVEDFRKLYEDLKSAGVPAVELDVLSVEQARARLDEIRKGPPPPEPDAAPVPEPPPAEESSRPWYGDAMRRGAGAALALRLSIAQRAVATAAERLRYTQAVSSVPPEIVEARRHTLALANERLAFLLERRDRMASASPTFWQDAEAVLRESDQRNLGAKPEDIVARAREARVDEVAPGDTLPIARVRTPEEHAAMAPAIAQRAKDLIGERAAKLKDLQAQVDADKAAARTAAETALTGAVDAFLATLTTDTFRMDIVTRAKVRLFNAAEAMQKIVSPEMPFPTAQREAIHAILARIDRKAPAEERVRNLRVAVDDLVTAAKREPGIRIEARHDPVLDPQPAPMPEGLHPDAEATVNVPLTQAGNAFVNAIGEPHRVVDSKLNAYGVHYAVLPAEALLTSHTDNLQPTDGYDQRLQGRQDAGSRRDWIEGILANFQTLVLQPGGVDVTSGPPMVWMDVQGRPVIAQGNGRTIALRTLLKTDTPQARAYREYTARWARAMGIAMPEGDTGILVRVTDIAPDDVNRAIQLGQNGQVGTSVEQSPTAALLGETVARKSRMAEPLVLPLRFDEIPAEGIVDYAYAADLVRRYEPLHRAVGILADDVVKREEIFNPANQAQLVRAVRSAVLTALPDRAIRSLQQAPEALQTAVLNAGPAILALAGIAATKPSRAGADVSLYLADALTLATTAITRGATSPRQITDIASQAADAIPMFGVAEVMPVSKFSVALAIGLMEAMHVGADGGELARRLRGLAREVESPQMMLGRPEFSDLEHVVNAFVKGSDGGRLLDHPTIVADHAKALENAGDLRVLAGHRMEARQAEAPKEPAEAAPEEAAPGLFATNKLFQTRKPKTATLFSGGGLVEVGLRGLIEPTFAVEASEAIGAAYKEAHGAHVRIDDVRNIDPKDAGEVDYLHASPVCKQFTKARNIDATSGEQPLDIATAQATARALTEMQPHTFTLENVKGYQGSEAMGVITKALRDGAYTFDARVYDAADFGAPTHRQRLLLRAVKDGPLPDVPEPTHGPTAGTPYADWFATVEDMLDDLPESEVADWMKPRLEAAGVNWEAPGRPILVMGGSAGKNIPYAFAGGPAPTIKATPKEAHRIILADGSVRAVTPRALARITGLPDDYPLPKNRETAVTIIGNGVPPALARAVFGPLLGGGDTERLAQHRDYARSTANPIAAAVAGAPVGAPERTLTRDTRPREQAVVGQAAHMDEVDPSNPYGLEARRFRAKPNMTREELNVALGYRPDQRTYDAVDLQARIEAYIVGRRLRERTWGQKYVRCGSRTQVPAKRLPAVVARVNQMLGDLPAQVARRRQEVHQLAPGAIGPTAPRTADTPLQLTQEQATRVRALLDHLVETGWADTVPGNVRLMPVAQIQQHFNTGHWNQLVDALKDSRSGAMSYAARIEQYDTGAYLVYWLTKSRQSPLTPRLPAPGQAPEDVFLNTTRSKVNDALSSIAFNVLPFQERNPNMPWDVLEAYQTLGRKMRAIREAIATRVEDAVAADRRLGGAGRASGALASIAGQAGIPIVDIRDLPALRDWLYTSQVAPPAPGGLPTQRVRRDLPRTAPLTIDEILAHRDLIYRTLIRQDRHRLDAATVDALTRLQAGTLTRPDAGLLVLKVYAVLNAAKERGTHVLEAAAGKSGGSEKVRTILQGGEYSGVELDAYDAWHRGMTNGVDWWGNLRQPGSVANLMVQALGIGKPVETHRWAFEMVAREYAQTLVDAFIDRLIDRDYVVDARRAYAEVNPTAPVPDVDTEMAFAADLQVAIRQIMLGKDVNLLGGHVAATPEEIAAGTYTLGPRGEYLGPAFEGKVNPTGMNESVRKAAYTMIARWGLIPDLNANREGIHKGSGAGDFGVVQAARPATGGAIDLAGVLADPSQAAGAKGLGAAATGRDMLFPAEMEADLQRLIETNAEVGTFFRTAIGTVSEKQPLILRAYDESLRQIKQHLIAGGPTLIPALVAAGPALLISGSIPVTAMVMGGLYAMTWLPPIPRYATNAIGAHFQMMLGLGLVDYVRTVASPGGVQNAALATRHTVRLESVSKVFDLAQSAVETLFGGKADIEEKVVVTKDGRIYTIGDIVREAKARGLDGTQAGFETLESAAERIDRLVEQEGDHRLLALFRQVYGRNEMAATYRRFYESIDTFARYSILIRSLQDGLSFDEGVKRTLLTTFDYTNAAALDRAVGKGVMFWMYQRRAIDLACWALVNHPGRVLGLMRFMRDQDALSGFTDDDQSETIPAYAQGRPAAGYLPVYGSGNVAALKFMFPEPPSSTALNLFLDLVGADAASLASRTNPILQLGANLATNTEEDYYSFFRRRSAGDPRYWEIPPGFVYWDRYATGGVFAAYFGFTPVQKTKDPYAYVTPGNPWHWYPKRFRQWDAFRSLLPGVQTGMSILDRMDRADVDLPVEPGAATDLVRELDEAVGLGLEADDSTVVYPGVTPTDAAPRAGVGSLLEMLGVLGLGTAPIAAPGVQRAEGERAYQEALKGATQKLVDVYPDVEPVAPAGGKTGIQPTTTGIRPQKTGITQ